MNYEETIEYLYNSVPVFEHVGASAYKPGLGTTLRLDEHLGFPHRKFRTIHVGGTNGKGSVSHSLAAILGESGLRVGLYTSPHLVDFRERIRVNGKPIPEQRVIDFVEQEREFFEPLHPSFFELTTALAFLYFAEEGVDVAVVEVGLGGRLDSTNIVTPLLSIITNISLDHTQQLGDTLAKIAFEKAGIIKHHIPVVVGEYCHETRPVFEKKAQKMSAEIVFAQDEHLISDYSHNEEGGIDYTTTDYGELTGQLGGDCQHLNMQTILAALRLLKRHFTITDDNVKTALAHVCDLTGLMGRWQRLQANPLVVCDTGHNTGGWQYLAEQIKRQHCKQRRIVFGMVDDKDFQTVMAMLPKDAIYYWTQASTHRAISAVRIADEGESKGLHGTVFGNVEEAYRAAICDSNADDFVFVGGSSYIVADLLASLQGNRE